MIWNCKPTSLSFVAVSFVAEQLAESLCGVAFLAIFTSADGADFYLTTQRFNSTGQSMHGHVDAVELLIQFGSKAIDTPETDGWLAMHEAASNGHVSVIETLIRLGSNAIDTPDHSGCSPLHIAALEGHDSVIELLVQLGSKAIDTPDHQGQNPLCAAAFKGHVSTIETLVRLGSNAFDTPNDSRTPFYAAALNGHVSAIELLVRLGSKAIDTPNKHGWTPLNAAAFNGHVSVIETLVRLGSKAIDTPNNNGWTPLHAAAWNGHENIINALVRLGSNAIDTPNNNGWTPMCSAASKGHGLVIETLVRLGSIAIDTPNNNGWTPLNVAASQGHVSVIETLVRLGSNAIDTPNKNGWTPLNAAARYGHVSMIETLVRLGSKAIDRSDDRGKTPVHSAASRGHVSVIEALVRLGSKAIDRSDDRGTSECERKTPLHEAAENGHIHVIEALIRAGSRALDTPDADDWRPLHYAVKSGDTKTIEALLGFGSQAIDTESRSGRTPLQYASQNGNTAVMETLLRLGSKTINCSNKLGKTSMHYAAESGNAEAVEVLLASGCTTIDSREKSSETPLFIAAKLGHVGVIDALIRMGSTAIDTPDKFGDTPLFEAAGQGHVKVIESLIRNGSKAIDAPNAKGKTPLFEAAEKGHAMVIESLISLGSRVMNSPNVDSVTPLLHALKNRKKKAVTTLLRLGAQDSLDDSGKTLLHVAAKQGLSSMVIPLVQLGSKPIDSLDNDGCSALHCAAQHGNEETLEVLVQQGSLALDIPDKDGFSPMHAAAQNGHLKTIETLVRLGSQAIDTPDKFGWTPMHAAAQNGKVEAMRLLVQFGSKMIDSPDRDGWTPLHAASEAQHGKAIDSLIEMGSKTLNTPNNQGKTPLASALFEKREDVVSKLLNSNADIGIALQPPNDRALAEICAQMSAQIPSLALARLYNPKLRSLSFQGEGLTNESAAALSLGNWQYCRILDFRNNPNLTEIPVSLATLDSELGMKITFDPPTSLWGVLEANFARSDSKEIINYAKLKANGGSVKVNERKLMAVGPAAVGKTTLIRRLKNKDYTHPLSTDGVDMGELRLPTTNGTMRIAVWDFAGQQIYRQTHLLFLRNPGLCLLLFKLTDDVKKSVEQLRYWGDTLRSFDPDHTSQLLLVGTHLDRCSDQTRAQEIAIEVWEHLKRHLTSLRRPILVSCANGASPESSIARLRKEILTMSEEMDLSAPACIEVVRKALLSTPFIVPLVSSTTVHQTLVGYASQMKHHRLMTEENLRDLCLTALQMLGFVIVVEKQGKMTHVVTNPQWVALLLATVVTTRHTWVKHGRVTFEVLSNRIWRGNERFPPETHQTLVSILEHLKIMFPLEKRQVEDYQPSQLFFLPCSLPEHRPVVCSSSRTKQHFAVRLHRRFMLSDADTFIPIGVLPEVIVQIMSLSTSLIEVWQHGCVGLIESTLDKAKISVIKRTGNSIDVIAKADQHHVCAEWIRRVSSTVENQLTDVYHLAFEELVPCSNAKDSCYLVLNDLRDCILRHKMFGSCRPAARHCWRLDIVASDLLFADLAFQHFFYQWTNIQLLEELGRGSFGKVMLGQLVRDEGTESIAIKLLESRQQVREVDVKNYREFQHEAYLMSLLHHPNIVRFVGVCFPASSTNFDHEKFPAMLMECVMGGTLYDALTDAAGLLKICNLATSFVKACDNWNTEMEIFRESPQNRSMPEPLDPFEMMCFRAADQINKILEIRIYSRASSVSSGHLDELRDLQLQLMENLRQYHSGPLTRQLQEQNDRLLDSCFNVGLNQ